MVNESLHKELVIRKGDFFVKSGQSNYRIGKILSGVLRGFTINSDGEEITTHFFIEDDLISGNSIPNIASFLGMTPIQLSRTRKTFSQQM